jgi:hypothetical protein
MSPFQGGFVMITQRLALSALLVLGMVAAVRGAQPPTLSGTWVLESSRSAVPGGSPRASGGGGMSGGGGVRVGGVRAGGGGGQPMEIVITQTAAELTIERQGPTPMKWVYKLDGSESVNTNGRTTSRTKSRREGRTLVTEGTQVVLLDGNEVRGTVKEIRSLSAEGQLVVETTRTAEGMTSAPPVTTQTFKKK